MYCVWKIVTNLECQEFPVKANDTTGTMQVTQEAYPDCICDSIARENRVRVQPAARRFRNKCAIRHLAHQ